MFKKLLKYSILTLLIVSLTACTDNSSNSDDMQKEKNEIITKRQNEIGLKYNAMMNWEDTLSDQLTIKIQKEMENKVVLFKGYSLTDVYQKGGSLIAKFDGYDGLYLIIKTDINSEVSKKLLSNDIRFDNLTVVVSVTGVTVPHIVLDPQTVDGEYMDVEVSTKAVKQVNGTLLDFIVEE